MQNKTRILMVCLGNICRSPLAEGILKSKIDPDLVTVESAGTAGYHVGEKPDERSIKVARKHGIDISRQRCRRLRAGDLEKFDLIYAMDRSNLGNILALAINEKERRKVKLLLDEVDAKDSDIPDPYYGGHDGFEKVFQLIDGACNAISKKLNKVNSAK